MEATSQAPVRIRPAAAADFTAVLKLFSRAVRDLSAAVPLAKSSGVRGHLGRIRSWIQDPETLVLVAENPHAQIVGVALLLVSARHAPLCCIVPEVLGSGIGRSLLSELELFATRKGMASVELASSITAKPFYENYGYTIAGPPEELRGILCFPMKKELSAEARAYAQKARAQ